MTAPIASAPSHRPSVAMKSSASGVASRASTRQMVTAAPVFGVRLRLKNPPSALNVPKRPEGAGTESRIS
jgi:hypothetical protein